MTELLFEETDFRSTWLVVHWKGSKPMEPIKCSQSHVVLIESCRKDGKDLIKDKALAHDTNDREREIFHPLSFLQFFSIKHVFFVFVFSNLPKQNWVQF